MRRLLRTDLDERGGREDRIREREIPFRLCLFATACKDSGAEYILMIEDDIVIAKGWYVRTIESLASVRRKMRNMGYHDDCKSSSF